MREESIVVDGCMACRTAAGEFADDEVYRDDRVVVVAAQTAINPGHLVVVTLDHVRNALTMDEDLYLHMNRVARVMALRMREALPAESIMFCFNNEHPCQTVFHAHLHVAPRTVGDDLDGVFGVKPSAEERAAVASRLRAALSAPLGG